jgi:hypothetical protein
MCPDAAIVFAGREVAAAVQLQCVDSAHQVRVCNVQLPKGVSNRDTIMSLCLVCGCVCCVLCVFVCMYINIYIYVCALF